MKRNLTTLTAALALLTALLLPLGMWGQTRDSYSVTYEYSDLGDMFVNGSSYANANGFWKVPASSGNNAQISIPIPNQPTSNITLTFRIATFGNGNPPSASNTTFTAVGTENNSNWSGSGVSSYPSSSNYVNATMTITRPQSPTTLGGLLVTMGVNTGIRILRLESIMVSYTYSGDTNYTVTLNQTTGGTISASPTTAPAGTTINLTATPASGYTFGSWSTSPEVAISNNSFTMPASNVTVSATWTQNGGGTGGDGSTLVFDFEDEGAHRASGSNSYSSIPNVYQENGATISLTYADAVDSGSPLSGDYHVVGRIAKNTTNSPVVLIGPINITNWTITKIEYKTKGVGAMSQVFATSLNNSNWTTQLNLSSMPTSATIETVDNLSITGTQLYLRWTVSVSSSTGSNRDFNLDDIVITYTDSSVPQPSITAADVNITYDALSGTIAYGVENEPDPVGTLTAAIEGTPTIAGFTLGTVTSTTVPFTCSANNTNSDCTATVRLTYTYGNSAITKDVTITQGHTNNTNYAILTFAYDGGRAAIANTNGLTQENLGTDYANSPKLKFEKGNKDNDGLYSTLILHFNERPGELSYDILGNSFSGGTFKVQVSTDGDTYTDWATYTQLTTTLQHITFNNLDENVRYIKWIYTQKVNGNVALGNIKLKKYEAPQPYTLSIEDLLNVRVYASAPGYSTITNGQNFTIPSVTVVTLIVQYSDDFVLDEILVLDEGNNPISLTPVPQTQNQWTFYMPNSDVTVSASVVAAHPPVNYVLASSVESGKRYIIVGQKNGQYYAMGPQKPNNRIAKLINVEGNTATVTRSDVLEFTITSLQEPGFYSIYDETEPGYLYAGDASENRLLTEATLDEDGEWEITINAQSGVASVVASNSNNNNVMQFNSNYELFNCYGSASQNPVYLYQIDDGFPLEITGYTGTKDHYYLISTPVTVDPATVEGMVTGDYDLYYFDQSQELEWINYKGDANLGHPGHFSLVPGTGYLYAKKATSGHSTYTFNLSGELYDGTGDIPVVEGWNLIGNPYTEEAEIEYYESYYIMNESIEGSEIIASEVYSVLPMQAVFFYNDAGASTVTFSRMTKDTKIAGISLNVSRDNTLVDRAIVRFGEGRQMPKFQLNPNSTKVFIPQNDKDYAVVRSSNEGEMPVSFKAEHNGTYTLSADITELEMDYLHLIDHMTGADVDLLATPSYTFEAKTTDYASRFKLVFSQQVPEPVEGTFTQFAYFNGSEWTVSNTGEATLQVVDVLGRIVTTQTINGNATLTLDQTPGIYMLRLVNGNDVKVQKIVVR